MPGVLMVEAMGQVGGLPFMGPWSRVKGSCPLAGIDGVRFRRVVRPGINCGLKLRSQGPAWFGQGPGRVLWPMRSRWLSCCFSRQTRRNSSGVKQMNMLIAGDAAGDASGAELAKALAGRLARLFGMGDR